MTITKKLLVLTKGMERSEEQNESLTETTQKKQLEFQWSTKKIWLLQQDLEEVQKNLGVLLEKLDVLVEEMNALRQKTKLTILYHYQMEEFDNLKMEHAFMKAKFLTY